MKGYRSDAEFGLFLKLRRAELGLTVGELCGKFYPLGPTAATVRIMEAGNGFNHVRLSELKNLADALGLTMGQILGEVPISSLPPDNKDRQFLSDFGVRW